MLVRDFSDGFWAITITSGLEWEKRIVILHGEKNKKDSFHTDGVTFCFTVEEAESIIKELRRATRYAKKMQELSNERDEK